MSDGMTYVVSISSGLIGSILTLLGTGYLSNKRDVKQKGEEVVPILNSAMNRINILKEKESFDKETLENHYKDFLADRERIKTIMDFHFTQESKKLVRGFLSYSEGMFLNLEMKNLEYEIEELKIDLKREAEEIAKEEKTLKEFESDKELTLKTYNEYSNIQSKLVEKKSNYKSAEDKIRINTEKNIENKYRLRTTMGTDSVKAIASDTQEILDASVKAIHEEYRFPNRLKRFFNRK